MDPETIIYLLWLAASFLVIWWGHANGRLKPGMHSTGLLAIRKRCSGPTFQRKQGGASLPDRLDRRSVCVCARPYACL